MGWRRRRCLELCQFGATLCEQVPGFAIAFVTVAGLFCGRDYGEQRRHEVSLFTQQLDGGDQVPRIFRNDVGGEQVDFLERVVALLLVVGCELATVSGAGPCRC